MDLSAKYLWHIVMEGARRKYSKYSENLLPEVMDRINHEMDIIITNKFTDYILIIWDIHDFCRNPERVVAFCNENGLVPPPDGQVPLGPGRGSVGGSMVCYCIDIHECDPILFGLYFERFLNPERIAYPDIDFDISQRYRHIVLAYISHRYGADRVAQIITYGTLSAKTVLHDVLRSANVSDGIINTIKETMPEEGTTIEEMEKNEKFMKALQAVPFPDARMQVDRSNVMRVLQNDTFRRGDQKLDEKNMSTLISIMTGVMQSGEIEVKSTWTWEKALYIMKRLEGLNKHESTHAAGVVVAPVELESNVPLFKKGGDGVLACQYDMRLLEDIGYLKMDALGLRTVDVNHYAEALVRKWYDPSFDIRKIRYDDEKAIKLINDGDTVGIFQIESTGFTQMMQQLDIGGYETKRYTDRNNDLLSTVEKLHGLEISDFMWISAGLALYRPGPLDAIIEGKTMVQHLIDRKAGREPVIYLFPEEKLYLEETYGVLVYQEQVMSRVRAMTGCTLGRADILRKAMGKKNPVLMKEQMDWFEQEAMKCNFTSMQMDTTFKTQIVQRAKDEIEKFSRYGFNKAHTVEYGHICYRNAYLKAHYPTAFYTALLNSEYDNPKRQTIIIRDMLKHDGIQLLPPTVNDSEAEFTMTDTDTIRFGLGAIKNIGGRAVDSIFADRDANGRYNSVEEFRIRVPSTDCTVVGMTNLAKCGAFDEFVGDGKRYVNRASLVESMKPLCEAIGKHKRKKNKNTPAPTVQEVLNKYNSGAIKFDISTMAEDPIEYSVWEKEILKYYISAHPIDAYVDEIARWNAIEDTELQDLDSECYIAGFIEGCHETVIKKEGRNKGKTMGFVTIGTAYRTYEATMFPGVYESCLPYIKVGNPVVMKCKKDFYKEQITLQCVYIRNMTNSGIRDCPECHIRLDDDIDPMRLITLKQKFDQFPGLTKVFLHVTQGYNDITIECNKPISLNDHIMEFCSTIGKLSYKPN